MTKLYFSLFRRLIFNNSEFGTRIRIKSIFLIHIQNNIWHIILIHLNNSYYKITEKFKYSLNSTIIGCICSLF